jgi:serine/threonine-protein kinase
MIGQTISHYQIVEKLGEGGMGVVYKAYDTTLKRHVALKFLPAHLTRDEGARKRFIHEAQAAAALDHPNICSVYEIGQSDDRSFIVMPLLEGQSLRDTLTDGALSVEEALDIAVQVGRGLAKAHGSGIVHRDIKPGNVLLTDDRQVKIVDFGLAKLGTQTKLTKTGMTVGTVAYMSPEQTRGEGVDHRTDVWSLGVMLYEMLAGRMPFRGDAEPAVVYSILNEDPAPVTTVRREVPVGLEDVVERALSKDVAKRYPTMDEMLSALETVAEESQLGITRRRYAALKRLRRRKRLLAGAAATVVVAVAVVLITTFFRTGQAIDRIAVLPFENLSGDPEQDLYANGVTEALIKELGKIGTPEVIGRTSVMKFKDTDKTLPEIAGELDVDAIIEGSVLKSGSRLEITAHLTRAHPEGQMWTDSYQRDVTDVLVLLSDVARTIAEEIQVTLTPRDQERLANVSPVDSVAWDLYLKGLHLYNMSWTKPEPFEKAARYFQQAVEIDSDYAEAYAMLADCYLWLGYLGALSWDEARAKSEPYLQRALEIDDMLADAHFVIAGIKHYYDWDWLGAVAAYQRALANDPGLVKARWEYALLLSSIGRFEDAISEAKHALRREPLHPSANMALGTVYYFARRYEQAIEQYEQMVELDLYKPAAYGMIAAAYEQMGKFEDAVNAYQTMMKLAEWPPEQIAALSKAYHEQGIRGYWTWKLKRYKDRPDRAYSAAQYLAQLGDEDQALERLEVAYERHGSSMHDLKVDPRLDPLRDDPRFQDLLRRVNFTD